MSITEEKKNPPADFEKAAQDAWESALSDFYHPPLPDVVIENDDKKCSYFYIDTDTWTVHLNTVGVPQNLDAVKAERYLRSICHHEINHYLRCPYDGVTNGMMFAGARRYVNDATAMFTCNLFADLVVDSTLLRRFPSLTQERIESSIHDSAMRMSNHSDLWNLIISCYHSMWGFPIPTSIDISEEISEAAKKITKIAKRYLHRMDQWKKATAKIAKIISEWVSEEDEQLAGTGVSGDSESSDIVAIPLDVDKIMGDPIEARNGTRVRRCLESNFDENLEEIIEKLAEEVENRGGTLEDLEGVLYVAGIGDKKRSWIRFWYRAKAKRRIRIEISKPRLRGSLPLSPDVWRLGDPVEELDMVQSLQAFPILIPNMSTRKWIHHEHHGTEGSKNMPDLLLVLDSSGSMTWSLTRRKVSGHYHLALLSAFSALELAIQAGSRIAAINFSDGVKRSVWSRDRKAIELILTSYQGGGTVIPMNQLIHLCKEATESVLVLMITDAEVANWENMLDGIKELISNNHHVVLFHIGSSGHGKMTRSLEHTGAVVYPVSNIQDLQGLVVREAKNVYYPK
jgi:hypothetical protein